MGEVLETLRAFVPLEVAEVAGLDGPQLMTAYDEARSLSFQMEIIETNYERTAHANVEIVRTEVLRRLVV